MANQTTLLPEVVYYMYNNHRRREQKDIQKSSKHYIVHQHNPSKQAE